MPQTCLSERYLNPRWDLGRLRQREPKFFQVRFHAHLCAIQDAVPTGIHDATPSSAAHLRELYSSECVERLYEKWSSGCFGKQFWINLLLTILGYIPGVVHAVWVIAKY
jgi:hypothetical protein